MKINDVKKSESMVHMSIPNRDVGRYENLTGLVVLLGDIMPPLLPAQLR